jgi:hypothetical protein
LTNWPEYNDALRQRGDITIWFTEEAIEQWHPVKLGARGRAQVYADHAIETAILMRQVFHLALRQTEGFMNSLARLMKAQISIPDFDGETVSNAVLAKQPEAQVVVVPHKTAVNSQAGDTQRDEPIRAIAAHGRIAWQRQNDYGLRSRVELAIQRYKRILGHCMKARALPQQKTQAWFSASALNMMTNLGMPASVKI